MAPVAGREGEPIPLSALQHAVYCMRQAALIHLERQWDDNRFTAEGHVLHAVVDKPASRAGRGVRRVQALPLTHRGLNLAGVADLVEFLPAADGGETPFPVEYKRGKPKLHRADEVQVCAQALCLEDMTGRPVPEGALYYAETKRRQTVPFDEALRRLTLATIADLAAVFASLQTPPPPAKLTRCRACSLIELCRPSIVRRSVDDWRQAAVAAMLAEGDTGDKR